MSAKVSLSVATFVLCTLSAIGTAQINYQVMDIGSPSGSSTGFLGVAINDSGQVVGASDFQGFLWTRGTFKDLGDILPEALNNRGQVVGFNSAEHAALWANGHLQDLGTFGGPISAASGINNREEVVGYAQFGLVNPQDAFLWKDGTMHDIGAGGFYGAVQINEREEIVGYLAFDVVLTHAGFWRDGVLQDMGTLGGDNSTPAALNNAGQAVGSSQLSNGHSHGFLWQNGHIQDLGVAPGYTDSFASAINEIGQIVGALYNGSELHPAIYASGHWTDLNDVVAPDFRPIVGGAVGINNRGTVLATEGSKFSGRTLLLVPKM
jgi:probable HAF family extracellular repeat protein